MGVSMPGHSYRGALPPLSPAQAELQSRLHRHIETLAGTIGERNLHRYSALQAAARYITEVFEELGYQPVAHPYHVRRYRVQNIEAVKPGSPETDEIIVIGAHYDSVRGSPGANDNASGVAALLELARLLRAQPVAREVRFVAFVNEEPPTSIATPWAVCTMPGKRQPRANASRRCCPSLFRHRQLIAPSTRPVHNHLAMTPS